MNRARPLNLLIMVILLSGCALSPEPATQPSNLYDSIIRDDRHQVLTIAGLAQRLKDYPVVVVGELHGHQASHYLQAHLQAALHRSQPNQILALEAFNLDHQDDLDRYLAGQLGERELMEDAGAWDNYPGSYRPLVEFARRHDLPVVAANAPASVVRCVGRQGGDYLDSLPTGERDALPERPFPEIAGYRERFQASLAGSGHGEPSEAARKRLDNTYQAQLLRDSTMADRILRARAKHPGHQLLMITGTFHSEGRQGLVAALEQRAPGLAVAVVTPVATDDTRTPAQGEFLYQVWPLPPRYRDGQRRQAALMEQFGAARNHSCAP